MKLYEEKVSSEHLVDGRLLQVYRDTVRLPDGTEATREWIDHAGAAAVVPVDGDGVVTLVRQYRYPARRTFVELPAGKFDRVGESPESVARRELREEVGLEAGSLVYLGPIHPTIGYSSEVIHLYLAQDIRLVGQSLDDGEFLEVVRMPFADAVAAAESGQMHDMKTALGLLMAAARLRPS